MAIDDIKHCLKVMVDQEVCEECNLYGTTGEDHCEHDCVVGALDIIDKYQEIEKMAENKIDYMRRYEMLRAQYNTRLKADVVAAFTEIMEEMANLREFQRSLNGDVVHGVDLATDILDKKIHELGGKR